ncbi:DUF6671 family protein [Pontibacter cellulosilyticus]|uniref:DUF6671 domain-containing protein n=1 Tax=Pontibacter cellulosilyticus TaxID=1720253 RepID=A0A923SJC8_9BACT|nr:DUF6671 family protein [Pontibacter cellulosilyticus]MBC5993683.1 hypothetical protein [Pontibacter cellulosilyticus]
MFRGRNLLIATKHEKEKVIAPLLEEALGVSCVVASQFDTDMLGTFTGEVEREADPVTTARKKCEMALELHGFDLAVASEGSFGPHPVLGFMPADQEILLLLDKKNSLEIVARELSIETNFAGEAVSTEEQLMAFAVDAKFPSHALVLRPTRSSATAITKGITDKAQLLEVFRQLQQQHELVYVETDMRAMYNPTRMSVIRQATEKLLVKVNSFCPACHTPGFGVTSVKQGLPCAGCGFPTHSIKSEILTCLKCDYTSERMYPNNKKVEDPAYCQLCNP